MAASSAYSCPIDPKDRVSWGPFHLPQTGPREGTLRAPDKDRIRNATGVTCNVRRRTEFDPRCLFMSGHKDTSTKDQSEALRMAMNIIVKSQHEPVPDPVVPAAPPPPPAEPCHAQAKRMPKRCRDTDVRLRQPSSSSWDHEAAPWRQTQPTLQTAAPWLQTQPTPQTHTVCLYSFGLKWYGLQELPRGDLRWLGEQINYALGETIPDMTFVVNSAKLHDPESCAMKALLSHSVF